MARTRAERRHNTFKKTSARKAIAIRGENDQYIAGGVCGGKVAPNGEIWTCSRCENCKPYEQAARATLDSKRLAAFILSQY